MGWFIITRALIVRIAFAMHGLVAIWLLATMTQDSTHWYKAASLTGLLLETLVTLYKKRGQEWKWFCPSVFFYLLSVVPAIWFLELHEMESRIAQKQLTLTNLSAITGLLGYGNGTAGQLFVDSVPGLKEMASWEPEKLVRLLEQLLLLILILGRWMLPKGALTHDQLSQLLLVYIGTAADIVEFFDAFKEDAVRTNKILCILILSIWSWSLLQFTLVLTATKERKADRTGLVSRQKPKHLTVPPQNQSCCTPDVYGIIISIMMQDAPFLVLRMLLIFKYHVLSYTNMFFTCKNTLVCMMLTYRLSVIQLERCNERYHLFDSDARRRETGSLNSWTGLTVIHGSGGANAADQYYHYATKVNLREPIFDPNEPTVKYVIKSRYEDLCPELTSSRRNKRKSDKENGVGGSNDDEFASSIGTMTTGVTSSAALPPRSKWRSCDDIDSPITDAENDDERRPINYLSVVCGSGGTMHCSDPELYSSYMAMADSVPLFKLPITQSSDANSVFHVSVV